MLKSELVTLVGALQAELAEMKGTHVPEPVQEAKPRKRTKAENQHLNRQLMGIYGSRGTTKSSRAKAAAKYMALCPQAWAKAEAKNGGPGTYARQIAEMIG